MTLRTHIIIPLKFKTEIAPSFRKYDTLFDGGLGHFTQTKIHIDLDPTIEPRHFKPYLIPNIHSPTFKKELDHLVDIGVLEKAGVSAWASPTFITPKKDGCVCWVSDLR